MSIKLTFLDSTAIFHILGATLGVNYVLKHIDNRFYWFITPWWQRIIRGVIGFSLNMFLVSLRSISIYNNLLGMMKFKTVTADYVLFAVIYACAGFVLYGLMPVFFSYLGLTDQEYMKRKKKKAGKNSGRKGNQNIESVKLEETPNFSITTTTHKEHFELIEIDDEDDRLSK